MLIFQIRDLAKGKDESSDVNHRKVEQEVTMSADSQELSKILRRTLNLLQDMK